MEEMGADIVRAGKPLIECIKIAYKANRPLLVIGRHGRGKSAIIEQATGELKIKFICRDLSIMEAPDLAGLPWPDGEVTRYRCPAFLPTGGAGILLFEELNRCSSDMRAACLQLLTARTLNDYRLPDGWLPAAAINPPDGDYDVQDLDAALLSRFVRLRVEAGQKEWLDWACARGLHEAVTDFVDSVPDVFTGDWSTPRSWEMVSDLLQAGPVAADDWVAADALESLIAGTVGCELAIQFRDFRKKRGEALPSGEDFLADYGRHQQQVRKWPGEGRLDLLGALVKKVKLVVQGGGEATDNEEWRRNLGKFLGDLPGDLAADLCKWLKDYGYEVVAATQPKRRARR
jgi:hypothetical protein